MAHTDLGKDNFYLKFDPRISLHLTYTPPSVAVKYYIIGRQISGFVDTFECVQNTFINNPQALGGSPGLVVMGRSWVRIPAQYTG